MCVYIYIYIYMYIYIYKERLALLDQQMPPSSAMLQKDPLYYTILYYIIVSYVILN